MARTDDLIFEWLSIRLPFGGGKAHEDILKRELNGDICTVLDIGCGRGTFKTFRKFDSTGIDILPDNIKTSEINGNYKHLIQGDIRELNIADKSFDAVSCIEIIEHLTKDEGWELLDRIERIARKTVIVTTPWGFYSLAGRKYNPYLDHQSGWLPEEFRQKGYTVYPMMSIRLRWGNNPVFIMLAYGLSIILRPLIKKYPEKLCGCFIAVKSVEGGN